MLIDSERQRAAEVQAALRRELDLIMSDDDLTREARDRLRARAIVRAREAMSALRSDSDERHQTSQAEAYREAFGLRPDRSMEDRAYRDMLAASPPSADEALRMFSQAKARGDDLAMRALAELAWNYRHSIDGNWVGLLDAYGAISEKHDRQITNLLIFTGPDKREKLMDKMSTEILVPPDMPGNVEALAREPDQSQPERAQPIGMPWA